MLFSSYFLKSDYYIQLTYLRTSNCAKLCIFIRDLDCIAGCERTGCPVHYNSDVTIAV